MMIYLLVALGGAIGSVFRHAVSVLVTAKFGDGFPWGTLLINISGSFLIGIIFGLQVSRGRFAPSHQVAVFLMSGVCGGFTTFSAFSLQTLKLANDGHWGRAGANCIASVVLSILGVWTGFALGQLIAGSKTDAS